MSRTRNYKIIYWLAALALTLNVASAFAERGAIDILVDTSIEPASAVGIMISAQGTIQKLAPTITKPKPGVVQVSFNYTAEEVKPDSVATALVMSESGEIAFGNVRPILSTSLNTSYLSIPECPPEEIASLSLDAQVSMIESLVQIRTARKAYAKAKLAKTLDDTLLARLRKLEHGFGLDRGSPLAADLPAVELVDRLSRLTYAINSYELSKQATPAP